MSSATSATSEFVGDGETQLAPPTLTPAQITAGLLYSDWWWGASSFTYSIPGVGAAWSGYSAGTQPTTDYSTFSAAQATQFRAAIAAWDRLIAPNFTETSDTAAPGNVRIAFTSFDMATSWGYAYAPAYRGGASTALAGDIWVSNDYVGSAFAAGSYDYEALLHEIGHAIGLKHSFQAPAIPAEYDTNRFTVMTYTQIPDTRYYIVPNGGSIQGRASYVQAAE